MDLLKQAFNITFVSLYTEINNIYIFCNKSAGFCTLPSYSMNFMSTIQLPNKILIMENSVKPQKISSFSNVECR